MRLVQFPLAMHWREYICSIGSRLFKRLHPAGACEHSPAAVVDRAPACTILPCTVCKAAICCPPSLCLIASWVHSEPSDDLSAGSPDCKLQRPVSYGVSNDLGIIVSDAEHVVCRVCTSHRRGK